ncbi:uncharacterized protein KY384_006188 [Bacidia gigantensis]|uniref:uncharacterized protein n=1 Tax=Bacidia gigantensis TaxID=2732470 RepID=UPI001D05B9BF|nr:uncharacterized protein KY384_006188 [Bacidia gigantensis]KAG8529551.1 hypothetical protein KY384_006188 [Bacidia gigantensis]
MAPQWASGGGKPHFPPGHFQMSDYSNLQVDLLVVLNICLALQLLFMGLRIWSRQIKGVRLVLNDYFVLAACFFNIAFYTVDLLGIFAGAARQTETLRNPPEQIQWSVKYIYPTQAVLWATVNTLVKFSMADLYTRVFPTRTMRISALIFSAICLINFIVQLVVSIVPGEASHSNTPKANSYIATAVINLVLDVIVIVMPMPALSTLQLRPHKKWSLIFVFALGFVITAISIARVVSFNAGLKSQPKGGPKSAHKTFSLPLTSYLETSLSVMNACLPVIFPAIISIGRRFSSRFSHLVTAYHKKEGYGHMDESYVGTRQTSSPRAAQPDPGAAGPRAAFARWKKRGLDKTLPSLPTLATQGKGTRADSSDETIDLKGMSTKASRGLMMFRGRGLMGRVLWLIGSGRWSMGSLLSDIVCG